MIKIVHAADLHLDSAFSSLSPEQAARMREEQRELLFRLVDRAERFGAQLIFLAGDLFDSARCHAQTLEALCAALGRTRARVFIAPGNHDAFTRSSPWRRMRLPENVHVFTDPEPEPVELSALGCTVWGAAFTGGGAARPLAGFRADGSGLNLMVLHGDTETPGSPYGYIPREDISASGLDYLALGHIHKFSGALRAGRTFYAYPGCAIGRGFDETGEKGAILAEVDAGSCRLELAPLGARRYETAEVSVTGTLPAAAVRAALPESAVRDIYRVSLTGECAAPPDIAALERELSGLCYRLELIDHTRPAAELWGEMGESSLRGGFLREMRALLDAAEDEEQRQLIMSALRFGIAALENREVWQ